MATKCFFPLLYEFTFQFIPLSRGFFYPAPSCRLRPKLQGGTMKKFFLMLLLLCWGLPVYAGGPIGDLTLNNIEEKLAYQNILNQGNWVPQVIKEEPAATWFSLNATTTFVAGHESRQTRLNRVHFFVSPNKAEPDLKKRANLYMDDILLAALTTAGLCIPKFDRDKQQV